MKSPCRARWLNLAPFGCAPSLKKIPMDFQRPDPVFPTLFPARSHIRMLELPTKGIARFGGGGDCVFLASMAAMSCSHFAKGSGFSLAPM